MDKPTGSRSSGRVSAVLAALLMAGIAMAQAQTSLDAEALRQRAAVKYADVPRKVLAFYYPWYGTAEGPGGAGQVRHWGRIDAARKDIEASTHYPALGAYDSHDLKVIEQHCRWAKEAGIDGWIVSWWGHGKYEDKAMGPILDACRKHGLEACIYYETVPQPQTAQTAADDVVKALERFADHPAHLRVGGKPVVFVYGRAVEEIGLAGWFQAAARINGRYRKGGVLIGDQFSGGAAMIFDGMHTYNTCGSLQGLLPEAAGRWCAGTFGDWVRLADRAGRVSTLTVIPAYDDTKIRKPGIKLDRHGGELYRAQWEQAIKADPHWVIITSFNEWHEGSEIEPSAEDGRKYLDLTAEFANRFKKAGPRKAGPESGQPGAIPEAELAALRRKLQGVGIAALPGGQSMGFWWLVTRLGVVPRQLTWQEVAAGKLSAETHPVLLYAGTEHYRSTVDKPGDVDAAIRAYLKAGGWLVAVPSLPMPFHYDENNAPVARHGAFGLNLAMGWERPPEDPGLRFIQPQRRLTHVPAELAFPASGDLRWRPFIPAAGARHTTLLTLRDGEGKDLGDAIARADPPGGGHVVYVWYRLLDMPQAEAILYDVFGLLAAEVRP